MTKSEIERYLEWVKNGDLTNFVKELADILYAVYETIWKYGLQDNMQANMEKFIDQIWVKIIMNTRW